jgi:AAA domain/Bifunctional DNA primase/polymerase, N-terminal
MTPGEPLRATDGFDPIGMSHREIRLAMLANGYEPLPLIGKAPIPKKWEQIIINEELIHGWANAGPNTGMRAATAPVLDIDILDEQAAHIVEATARLYLEDKGEILVRIGLPPKRAILLRTDKPFKKIVRKLTAPDGKPHKIEVLGDGQQLAVAGIHPDTQRPYVWKGGRSPVNTPRPELPLVDEDEIRTILDLCTDELRTKLGWGELDVAPPADTNGYDATYTPIPERIERMQYGGEYPINDTLLSYTGEQLRSGVSSDDVIADCRARVRKVYEEIPGNPQERPIWDWTRIHHQIDAMVYGYIEKNYKDEPRIIETLPTGMLEKWRKIERLGGAPTFKKRRHWGVEDTGPAEEIPTVEAPPIAPEKLKRHKPANVLLPFKAFDVASLPRRRWLLDQHYMRGVVSITAGMGGRGKSSNSLVEAIVLATAKPLLREPPGERCRVWYHCGDDNMEELYRRVAAICQRYNLDMAELEGWLFLTTPREFELRVAEGYMEVKTDDATINRIHDQIEASAIDVAILDPLVKLHSVREADVGMDRVIGVFQAVADEQGCSVEIVHHTRKGAAGQGDAMQGGDDMRGSSSIQGAVRSQRMVNVMPTAEAARLQIPEADRRRYIRITNEKTNYAPPGHGGWFKLASVELANGDCVGVVEPWRHPDEGGEITPEMAALQAKADDVFLATLTRFNDEGRAVSPSKKGNYAPRIFVDEPEARDAGITQSYLEAAMRRLIKDKRVHCGRGTTKDSKVRDKLEVVGDF